MNELAQSLVRRWWPWCTAIGVLAAAAVLIIPGHVAAEAWHGAWGDARRAGLTLRDAAPLLWCALGAAVCLRCGVLNIGLEGQYLLGAVTAVAVATALPPGPGACVAALMAGAGAGALWAGTAGLLGWRGAPIVLATLLLNVVAVHVVGILIEGPLRDPATTAPQTAVIDAATRLPLVWQQVHLGALLALGAAALWWLIAVRTVWGYEADACGAQPSAARLAGIPVARRQAEALLIGGGLAGLGGAVQAVAVLGSLGGIPTAYGFAGLLVALLGRLHPAGLVLAAVIVASLGTGCRQLERRMDLPRDLADVLQAVLVLAVLVASALALRGRR
jgi:general nucleoside transport system permease protein